MHPIRMTLTSNQTPIIIQKIDKNLSRLPAKKSTPVALNSPMVHRIHTTKPGCGSCGR